MNLPNKLTLTRILLVPVFMIFVSLTSLNGIADGTFQPTYYLIAGIVFAAASFTDFLDGHLARKWNMVTDFGKFADPLADKLLTTVAFIYMMRDGVCSPVVLCIILAREFAVSGLRMVAAGAKDGKVIAANMWGKVKTMPATRYHVALKVSVPNSVSETKIMKTGTRMMRHRVSLLGRFIRFTLQFVIF